MPRIFIIDPVCAMEYGHSLNALKYFQQMAEAFGKPVEMVASRHLPGQTEEDGIIRFFEFHYEKFLKIERQPKHESWVRQDGLSRAPEVLSSRDFCLFLQEHDITSADTLLFPSVDYYTLVGCLNALGGMAPELQPRLLLRFIGVMETASLRLDAEMALKNLVRRVRDYMAEGGRVSLCAETPKYARRLRELIGGDVATVPYFSPAVDPLPIVTEGPITFLAGGSARHDKGFFRLADIIEKTNARIGAEKAKFIVQSLPDSDYPAHEAYLRKLLTLPNVELLPGQVPYAEIKRSFAESHVGLMPYAQDIYQWRGSAMLMEAMLFQRLVICQSGTGFSDQARLYNAGQVCQSDDDFVDAICIYAETSASRIEAQAAQARQFYLEDVDKACAQWMKGAVV